MFFNLKEAAEHGVNIGTNWSSYSHSAIRFDEPQTDEAHPEYVTILSCNSVSNGPFASLSEDMSSGGVHVENEGAHQAS